MKRWDGLVEKYSALLRTRGLAESTITARERELVRFGAWLKSRRPRPKLEDVDAELIVRYVKTRSAFHARSSVASVMSSLKCMGEYLVQEAVWLSNPLRWMRGPKPDVRRHLPWRIGKTQQEALWAAAQQCRQEHARQMATCVLAILYGTGLRRGELERLDVSDWDREGKVLTIDGQKTGTERRVPVGDGVAKCIEAYLPQRHNRLEAKGRLDESALLVNTLGERLTAGNLSHLLSRLCETAGVPRVTLHQFRHSCASDLLEAGVTLPEVQRVLGHAVIQSTVRYLAVADLQRTEAISRHPVNRFLQSPPEERRAS